MSFPKIYERFAKRPISMHEDRDGKDKDKTLANRRRSSMTEFDMLFSKANFRTKKRNRVSVGSVPDFPPLDPGSPEGEHPEIVEEEDDGNGLSLDKTDQDDENLRPGLEVRPETEVHIPSRFAIKAASEAYHGPFPKPKSRTAKVWAKIRANVRKPTGATRDIESDIPEHIGSTWVADECLEDDLSPSSSFADLVRMVSNMSIHDDDEDAEDLTETNADEGFHRRPMLQHAYTSPAILTTTTTSLDLVRTASSSTSNRPSTPASPSNSSTKEVNAAKAQLLKKLGINKKPEPELAVSPTISVTSSDGDSTDSDKSFGCVGMSTKEYSEMLAAGHTGFRKPKPDDEYPKPRYV